MNHHLMTELQQSTGSLWALDEGRAMRLRMGTGGRELQVVQGRMWLTLQGTLKYQPADVWLEAGQSLMLRPGSDWVAEGWGPTRFQLLVPPPACQAAVAAVTRVLRRVLRWARRGGGTSPATA